MRLGTMLVLALVSGCAAPRGHWVDPRAVVVAPSHVPPSVVMRPLSPPAIQALWMNETTIRMGGIWRGEIVTSTNVESVEIRTESFTFNARRVRPGFFTFSQDVLDMVPQYRRAYTLEVIARNTAGVKAVWLVPIVVADEGPARKEKGTENGRLAARALSSGRVSRDSGVQTG